MVWGLILSPQERTILETIEHDSWLYSVFDKQSCNCEIESSISPIILLNWKICQFDILNRYIYKNFLA